MEKRDNFILEHQADLEQLLSKFIALKSVSVTNEGIDETVKFLKELLIEKLKAKVEIIPTIGHPVIVAKMEGKSRKNVLFYGHYDVMVPGDISGWRFDPFTLTKSEKRLFGRGVGDNKGQLLAQIFGLYSYLELHGNFPFNVTLFIEGEEEQGSVNLKPTLEKIAKTKLQQVDTAIVVDGAFGADGTHVLRMGNRGVFAFELISKTGTHDNHSGNLGNVMKNPFEQLLQFLDKIYDHRSGKVKIPYFYDGVLETNQQEKEWIKQLPYNKGEIEKQSGIDSLKMDKVTYYQNLMFKPTFNFFGVTSGYQGSGVKTIIPNQAKIKIDCRLVGEQSISKIKKGLKEVLGEDLNSGRLQLNYLGAVPPEHTQTSDEQIDWIYHSIIEATGKAYIEPSMPGTVPNYVWKDILKVPVFTIPYANYDEHNHDFNENLTENAFLDGIRISYELLNQYSN